MVSTWFQPCFISYQFYFIPIHYQKVQEKKNFLHITYQDFDQTGQCLSFPVLELSTRLPSYSTSPLHHDADGHYNSKIISNNSFTIRSIKISNDGAQHLFPETCTINTVLGDFPYWQDGIFNSLVPGRFKWYFRHMIFKLFSVIDGWGISCEMALRQMTLDLTYDKSTLVQVMAWCRQATSHYLSQCGPRSMSPYGVTRPQWVKLKFCWHSGTWSLKWQWLHKHDRVPVQEVQNGCHIALQQSGAIIMWFNITYFIQHCSHWKI